MKFFWKAARTRRYHTEVILGGEQTVADHSWGVAKIVLYLWPNSSMNLVKACLDHDLLEHFVGDSPAPAKWRFPELKAALDNAEKVMAEEHGLTFELSEEEHQRLKAADVLEACLFAKLQMELGNRTGFLIWDRLENFLKTFVQKLSPDDRALVQNFFVELKAGSL